MDYLSSLPRWSRIAFTIILTIFAIGLGSWAFHYFARPTNLTIAVGSVDGEAARLMSMIAGRLADTGAGVRLTVIDKGDFVSASKAFSAGETDLAIVRDDIGDLSNARRVIQIGNAVVLIVAPPGSAIEGVGDFKDKVIGVTALGANRRLIDALIKNYELPASARFVDLPQGDVRAALQSKRVHAVCAVIPLSEKYISIVRSFFSDKQIKLTVIPIEAAEAIANVTRYYESFELPKGTLRGAPPIPEEDVTTLRIPFHLVARDKLDQDTVTSLTKAIMEVRRALIAEQPLVAQFAAPSADKDAAIPIHRGATAYFEGTQKTFFEKYGDYFVYGPMLLGAIGSVAIAAWNFMGFGASEKTISSLDTVYGLARRIRHAESEDDLLAVEEEIDNFLQAALTKYSRGDANAADAAALSLAVHRIEHLMGQRRKMINAKSEN